MRIGIDLDGVTVEILDECVRFLKSKFIETTAEKITSYHLYEQFPVSREETMEHWKNEDAYHHVKFKPDALRTIDLLSRNRHPIYFVTHRPNEVARYTVNWLRVNKIPYNNVLFTDNKQLVASNYMLNVFIDDNIDVCNSLILNPCRKVYLFDAPYNRKGRIDGRVIRVKSWNDFLDKFREEFGLDYDDK